MTEQVPSVGRIVHYIMPFGPTAGEHRPAIIVRIKDDAPPNTVCLQVFMDGADENSNVVWAPDTPMGYQASTWHWPEYIPATR